MESPVQIHLLDASPGGEWERRLATYAETSVFHSAAWLRVLQRTYGYELFYLLAELDPLPPLALPIVEVRSGRTGLRGVSLPFSGWCPPLGAAPGALGPVLHTLLRFGRKRGWTHVELRGGACLHPLADPSITYSSSRLDLRPGTARVRASFAASARRAWQKAERLGVRVAIETSEEALLVYCRLAAGSRRHGAPPPLLFFQHLHEELFCRQQGFVAVGYAEEAPIAASIFLHDGKMAVHQFGASDAAFLRLYGKFAVMGEALVHLAERGFHEVDLGRTPMDDAGTRRFQRLWGGTEKPLHYYRLGATSGRSYAAADTPLDRSPATMHLSSGLVLNLPLPNP